MTSRSEVELVLDRYLAEGAEQVPDRVIDAALDQVDQIPQRRALRVPWRFHKMPSVFKLAVAGAAVVAVLAIGGLFLNRGPTDNVGGPRIPSPSSSAAVSPLPSASPPDTTSWVPFTSERYGYEIAHPPGWKPEPATRAWQLDTDRTDWLSPAQDVFIDRDSSFLIRVSAWAADVPADMSDDEWIAAYFEGSAAGCGLSDNEAPAVFVDGHRGLLVANEPCSDAQAFVFVDGRVYVFALWRADQVALLKSFLTTVRLRP